MPMDPSKCPYISEESLRTQRVSVYLNDLKQRIKGLRAQHDLLIKDSTEIFNEVNDVTTTLCAPHFSTEMEKIQSIKLLIQKFEEMDKQEAAASTSGVPDELNSVNVRQLLQEFEELNSSNVLTESLMNFKRAKDSFEEIETSLEKLNETEEREEKITKSVVVSNSLREKINMFERKLNAGEVTLEQSRSDIAECKEQMKSTEDVQMAGCSVLCHTVVEAALSVKDFKGLQAMVSDNIKLRTNMERASAEVTSVADNMEVKPLACDNGAKSMAYDEAIISTDVETVKTLTYGEVVMLMTAGEDTKSVCDGQPFIIDMASKETVNTQAAGKENQSISSRVAMSMASSVGIGSLASNTQQETLVSDSEYRSIASYSAMHSIASDSIMASIDSEGECEEKSVNSLREVISLSSDGEVISSSCDVINKSSERVGTPLIKVDSDTGDISAVHTALFEISSEP